MDGYSPTGNLLHFYGRPAQLHYVLIVLIILLFILHELCTVDYLKVYNIIFIKVQK